MGRLHGRAHWPGRGEYCRYRKIYPVLYSTCVCVLALFDASAGPALAWPGDASEVRSRLAQGQTRSERNGGARGAQFCKVAQSREMRDVGQGVRCVKARDGGSVEGGRRWGSVGCAGEDTAGPWRLLVRA